MSKFNHSFANYPLSFKGCVVSPTKICLQFANPEIKLRIDATDRDQLPKLPNNDVYLPVPEHGVEIAVTAVGCQMPVVENYQLALIDAYKKYYRLHNTTYEETYGKKFLDFLLTVQANLGILIDEIKFKENKDNCLDNPCTD